MSLRASAALTTAAWRTAKSYRLSFVLSFASLAVTIIPVYFVANALQPFMASVIADEGREYFGFVLLGTAILTMVSRRCWRRQRRCRRSSRVRRDMRSSGPSRA
jgi:hypothetical protein